jgi:hypothetical protein
MTIIIQPSRAFSPLGFARDLRASRHSRIFAGHGWMTRWIWVMPWW